MNKHLLAAAICAGCAGAAAAQSNVTVYGVLDLSIVNVSGSTPGSTGFKGNDTKVQSGTLQGSRLGFRGTEDLGNGLSAIFTIESGILADTGASDQGGLTFGREASVGIRSRTLGALTLGRQYGPEYLAWKLVDPMGDGFAGAGSNFFATNGKRINNAIKYTTPTVNGLTADVLYGVGEVAGNSAASRDIGGSVVYIQGPVVVRAGYNTLNNATASDKATNYVFGGSYDFRTVKAIAIYGNNKGTGSIDNRDLLLGASVPLGASTLLLSHIRKDDKSKANKDGSQIAVTLAYDLSKRTIAYVSGARLSNKNGANYHTFGATLPTAAQTGAVAGTREINIGLRHGF